MAKLTIPAEEAKDIVNRDNDDWEVWTTTMVSKSRWTIKYRAICQNISASKFYEVFYNRGATESQDDEEMFYDDNVDFIEVELKEVKVMQWVTKE